MAPSPVGVDYLRFRLKELDNVERIGFFEGKSTG